MRMFCLLVEAEAVAVPEVVVEVPERFCILQMLICQPVRLML
jgi:hypothetical protein